MSVTSPRLTLRFGCYWQSLCLERRFKWLGPLNGLLLVHICRQCFRGMLSRSRSSSVLLPVCSYPQVLESSVIFSDRSTMKMGRRRPFLIVAGVLSIVCWIAMGYTREMGEALGDHGDGADGEEMNRTWTTILTVFFYLWMDITVNIVQTPAMLLVADFAGDRQTTGAALGQAWATLGAILIAGYMEFSELPTRHCIGSWYGYTAYNGNKGQFFGLEVYGEESENADSCDPCSTEQDAYNHGVSVAGGRADLLYNVVGYLWAWGMPFMVHKIGVRWVLVISTAPQVLFTAMAWISSPSFDVFVVAMSGITHAVWFALVVPVIIHVFGEEEEIGVFVEALNSANCFGQLLNFAIGTGLVQTSLGYKLPVFIGGIASFLGFLTMLIFFKMKMHSM